MAIKTRQTTATGVTNNNAPLTNDELDNNFVELVAEDATKADLSGATFTGDVTIDNNSTSGALKLQSGDDSNASANRVQVAFGFNETNDYQHFIQTRHNSAAYVGNGIDIKLCDSTQNNTIVSGSQYALSLDGGDLSLYNNSDTVKFFWDSSAESLGIGTSNPSAKLDIVSGSDNANTLLLSDSTTNNGIKDGFVTSRHYVNAEEPVHMIQGRATSSTNEVLIGGSHLTTGYNTATDIKFYTAANNTTTNPTEGMRLDSSGNLGIGTGSNISSDLHLHRASAGASQFRITDSATGTGASDGLVIGVDANVDAYFWNYENADVYFGTNNSTRMTINESGKITIKGSSAPASHAWLNIGYNSGETRAIDIDGAWNTGESKSISWTHGTSSSNIVAQINGIYDNPNSSLRFGRFFNNGDTTSYPMVLSGTGSTTADLKLNGRLLNSQGARLHNEPASGLRGTGMNMTDAGAVDTGSNYSGSDQNARGIVWTGKYYIVVNYAANSNKGRFYRLNGDLSQGEFKNGSVTLDHNETDLFYPHGAAWDGRYLAVVGRETTGSNPTDIHIFDVDNLTSGYATRIAKIDVSSIGTATAAIGYAEGLYWIKHGTTFTGIEIDFASQTFTTVKQATGLVDLGYQFIAYDGSYIYGGSNGGSIYKHNLDGTVVTSVATGVIPQCTGMTWNGQEFIGIEYNTGNIWAIPVEELTYRSPIRIETKTKDYSGTGVDAPLQIKAYNDTYPVAATFDADGGTDNVPRLRFYNDGSPRWQLNPLADEFTFYRGDGSGGWTSQFRVLNGKAKADNKFQAGSDYSSSSNATVFVNHGSNTTPATSGTTQNCPLRLRGGDNAMLDFGVNGGSGAWIQATNATSLNLKYPLDLNPNGGVVRIRSNDVAAESGTDLIIGEVSSTDDAYVEFHADDGRWAQHLFYFDGVTAGTHDLWRVGAHKDSANSENFYRIYSRTLAQEMARFDAQNDQINFEANSITHYGAQPKFNLRNQSSSTNSRGTYVLWQDSDGTQTAYVGFGSSSNDNFIINQSKAADMLFYVNGSARLTIDSGGDATFSGEVTVNSDERIKDNIEQIDGALEKVQAIRGVTFTRNDTEDDRTHVGVIAQEVEKVLPEVVKDGEDGIKSVAYANMVGLLIEAIKEQQTQIDDLKAEVTRLKGFE